MHLAYIISAYQYPAQLVRLVRRLDDRDAVFAIHVDRRAPAAVYERMREGLAGMPNIRWLERHPCHWGDFGHVRATLKGIETLLQGGDRFDYAILLTGQDYPLRPAPAIRDFFALQDGRSFLHHFSLPAPQEWRGGGMERFDRLHVRLGGRHLELPALGRRAFPTGFRPYGGSAYWCLARPCIETVWALALRRPDFVRFFERVNIPDESFFQTALLNSDLRGTIVNDDLRYIAWPDPESGSPAMLTMDDYGDMMASGKLFARKFDLTVDSDVVDQLDAQEEAAHAL